MSIFEETHERIENYTGFTVQLVDYQGKHLLIIEGSPEKKATVSRVQVNGSELRVDGVPIACSNIRARRVAGLPSPMPGTLYLVNSDVAEALAGIRQDVIYLEFPRDHEYFRQAYASVGYLGDFSLDFDFSQLTYGGKE